MWEYLNKKIRPGRPRPESTDVHRPHAIDSQAQSSQVNVRGEDAGQDKAAESFSRLIAGKDQQGSSASRNARAGSTGGERRQLLCPVCGTRMQLERVGRVELDRCPKCRGIFLDRGELEQISGRNPSSYVPDQPATGDDQQDFLIYTPHGLSDHVRDA